MMGNSASNPARLRPSQPPQVDSFAGQPAIDLCDSDTDAFNFDDVASAGAGGSRANNNPRGQRGQRGANIDGLTQPDQNAPLRAGRQSNPPPQNDRNPYAPSTRTLTSPHPLTPSLNLPVLLGHLHSSRVIGCWNKRSKP